MYYKLLKWYARLAIKFYCRKIIINKPEILNAKGPILFAANHPNSFLDGMILTTLLEGNLYSLARGDAFKKPKVKQFLYNMKLLPVYRTSEGVENLAHNYTTFAACHDVFAKSSSVIIFSEGRCTNEWHLRPLRKGTARLALSSWKKGLDITVIPVGFNYNTFRNFGKNVFLNFGEPLDKKSILQQPTEGRQLLAFNEQLRTQLEGLVYELHPTETTQFKSVLSVPQPVLKKMLLAPFAGIGWLLHLPIYYPIKAFAQSKFDNDHFDSVVAALTILSYPIYLLLWVITAFTLVGSVAALIAAILLPLTAWACVQLKPQLN